MKISKRMILSAVALMILTSIVVYSADAAGIPKKAISTVSRFIESDLPTTTLFTDVANTITAIQQFTTTSAVFENPAHTHGTTLAGGAVAANQTLNLPAITGTDTVATLGLAQTFTGTQTINSLILGGDENVGSNALTNTGHKSTLPLTTGQLLQINGSAASLTNNVRGVTAGTGISVNGSTGTVQVTNAGVTSATGTSRNVTVSASTGAVTWNLGDNVVVTGGSSQTFTQSKNFSAALVADGLSIKRLFKTADYTATSTDDVILMDSSGATRTLTLPSASSNVGKIYTIKNVGFSAGNIVIISAPTDKIDANFGNFNMTHAGESIILQSNGTTWHKLSYRVPTDVDIPIKGSTTRWFGAGINGIATSTLLSVITTIRAEPWIVPHTIQIDKIQVEISTAANPTSTNCRMGIYRDNGNGYPQTLVTNSDAGTITTTAAVHPLTFASPITLEPGLYWQAWSCGTAATTQPTFRAWGIGSTPSTLGVVSTMGANSMGSFYTVAFTFAALPATFPAGATITANSAVPQILVEVSKG